MPPVTVSAWPTTSPGGDGRHQGRAHAGPTVAISNQEVEVHRALLRASAAHRVSRVAVDRARAARLRRVLPTAIAMLPIPVKH